MSFNLLDEPWIRVRDQESRVSERSITQVFRDADELQGLAGELPTQDAAILRLLLAIMLSATRVKKRNDAQAIDQWSQWWRGHRLPLDVITQYLAQHRERFDLVHPTEPFMQVATLTTASGKRSGLGKLIAEIPDGAQFFTTRAGSETESLSLAEATRWLIHCQAFDPAGIKTGAVGDDRVKGGKGYSLGYPAWSGNLGLVLAEGANVLETLLLNLPLFPHRGLEDLPVWERAQLTAAVDASHPDPTGPADLFTWPSRRICLIVHQGRVTDVQISNGDKLGPQNKQDREPHSSWHYSQPQEKKLGYRVYMPTTHSPERQVWQGLGSLLVTSEAEVKDQVRAPILDWLNLLVRNRILPSTQRVRLRVVGLQYGTQNSVIDGAVDDALQAQVGALTDERLVQLAVNAADSAGKGVMALAKLASNLAQAAGGDQDAPRGAAFERGYSLLDIPFRTWVAGLSSTDIDVLQTWHVAARRILDEVGVTLVKEAGTAAWVGRDVQQRGSDATVRIDSSVAHVWFRASLAKAFPLEQPAHTASPTTENEHA